MAQENYSVANLFGLPTPEEFGAYRNQQDLDYVVKNAPQSGLDQLAMLAGRRAGRATSDWMGNPDPELQRVTKIHAIGKMVQDSGVDPTNPDEVFPAMINGFQQAGLQKEALMAAQQYEGIKQNRNKITNERLASEAQLTQAQAAADEKRNKVQLDEKMRKELSELPPDATDEDIMRVMLKYASADKGIGTIQSSLDKAANRENTAAMQRERIQAQQDALKDRLEAQAMFKAQEIEMRIQIAKMNNTSAADIARMRIEGQKEIAAMRAEAAAQLAAFKEAMKADKPMDDKQAKRVGDNKLIDQVNSEGDELIKKVEKSPSTFNLVGRARTAVKSVVSGDDPEVALSSDVQTFLERARNAYLQSNIGVQTDKDAERAWTQFVNKLDFSSAAGVKRSIERVKLELVNQKKSNEAYLKARSSKSDAPAGSKENPIKLD